MKTGVTFIVYFNHLSLILLFRALLVVCFNCWTSGIKKYLSLVNISIAYNRLTLLYGDIAKTTYQQGTQPHHRISIKYIQAARRPKTSKDPIIKKRQKQIINFKIKGINHKNCVNTRWRTCQKGCRSN